MPARSLLASGPPSSGTAVQYTAAGHLLVGYVALGIVPATRPHLTGARD